VKRYVYKNLRRPQEIESAFEPLVKPEVGKLGIHELSCGDVARMLDRIRGNNGPVAEPEASVGHPNDAA